MFILEFLAFIALYSIFLIFTDPVVRSIVVTAIIIGVIGKII